MVALIVWRPDSTVLNFKSVVYRMHTFFFGCHMMPNSISVTMFIILFAYTPSQNTSFISITSLSLFLRTKPERSRASQLVSQYIIKSFRK